MLLSSMGDVLDDNELQAGSLLFLTGCSLSYNKLIEPRAVKGL